MGKDVSLWAGPHSLLPVRGRLDLVLRLSLNHSISIMHPRLFLAALAVLVLGASPASAQSTNAFELREGDRVVLLGDTFIEREQRHGFIEHMLVSHFPGRRITFRNLGWSADTPLGVARAG